MYGAKSSIGGKAAAANEPRRQDREIRKLKGELIRETKNFSSMVKKYQKELEDVTAVSEHPFFLSSS